MYKINVKIELFKYDELKEDSKDKAFDKHVEFLNSVGQDYENEDGDMMVKFDYLNSMSLLDVKEHVEESIRINEYLFFENGDLADITHYCGKHPKAGKTEFKHLGKIYEV